MWYFHKPLSILLQANVCQTSVFRPLDLGKTLEEDQIFKQNKPEWAFSPGNVGADKGHWPTSRWPRLYCRQTGPRWGHLQEKKIGAHIFVGGLVQIG